MLGNGGLYLQYHKYLLYQEEDLDSGCVGQMEGDTSRIAQFYDLLNQSIDVIRIFCDRIPGKTFQQKK